MAREYSLIRKYFHFERRCFYYDEAVKMADRFRPHSDGCFPAKLIECRRPNEPIEVKDYRKEIYIAKTKPSFSKILSSLGKIRRSSDWMIKYPDTGDEFSKIIPKESLQEYCEKDYPGFTSVTNWVFSVLLKEYSIDPNAVVLVMPENTIVPANEYVKPIPYIFSSCHVIDFEDGKYALLQDPTGCYYTDDEGKDALGKAFYEIDTTRIIRYEQINKEDFEIVAEYPHNFPEIPACKIKALVKCAHGMNILYESRLSGILEEFDEALRENSDTQGAKVIHLHPERWETSQHECLDCKGTGIRKEKFGDKDLSRACIKCDGKGVIAAGPFSKMIVRPVNNALNPGGQLPIPPAGYIQKDIAILELMMRSVDKAIYTGLSAINFQFIDQVPLNESGRSKEVDKEELNNTVHSIAEDLVRIMDLIYKYTAWWRYSQQYSIEQIKDMLPSIPVPQQFDLLSAEFLQTELSKAKDAKLNPVIICAMELDYANKRFSNEPEVAEILQLVFALDPLPNVTQDEKMAMLGDKGITQVDYVISCNIYDFIKWAIYEDSDFAKKDLAQQRAVMERFAAEVIAENTPIRKEPIVPISPTEVPENPDSSEIEDDEIEEEEPIVEDDETRGTPAGSDPGSPAPTV